MVTGLVCLFVSPVFFVFLVAYFSGRAALSFSGFYSAPPERVKKELRILMLFAFVLIGGAVCMALAYSLGFAAGIDF